MLVKDEDIHAVVNDRYPAVDYEDCPLNEGVPLVRIPTVWAGPLPRVPPPAPAPPVTP